MFKILVFISVAVVVIVLIVGGYLFYKHSQKQNMDMTPRDRQGNELDDEVDEDDPSEAPVYEDDVAFDDWNNWEDLLQEAGIIDIREGMIEYETGNNSRMFIALAEMQQSNPYLKTDDELGQQNAIQEVFFNGVQEPLKLTSQSQRVEMTDFLNRLKDNSQRIIGSNPQMKGYAAQVIQDTLNYQSQTDRFENRAYLQFMAIISPDEVYGDSPQALEDQIHKKAAEKLFRQIDRANGLLKRADHALAPLDTFGLLEVIYKTFNRESSVKTRLEDIVKQQRYQLFTSAKQPDKYFKQVQQQIHIETEAINHARDILLKARQQLNKKLLSEGKDYYQDSYDESDALKKFDDIGPSNADSDVSTSSQNTEPDLGSNDLDDVDLEDFDFSDLEDDEDDSDNDK